MADPPPPRKPRFHAPVVAPYLGDSAALPSLVSRLATLPQSRLGACVDAGVLGSQGVSPDPRWSDRVRRRSSRRPVRTAGARAAPDGADGSAGDHDRPSKRPRTAAAPAGPRVAPVNDGDGYGDDNQLATPGETPRRPPSRRAARPPPDKRMMEALSACVRQACGLPSFVPIGKGSSPVRATLVGDPNSRSRAIVLQTGGGKSDSAILWASHRGGVLCSCFAGTHNALFLSASSRSCTCKHTVALRKCLTKDGIDFSLFWRRMHLGRSPADFVCRQRQGPMQFWVVLYRSVYSLVSFSAANVATCIAPCCRRFRARCGHVALARPFNAVTRAADIAAGVKPGAARAVAKTSTPGSVRDGQALPPGLPEEDAGIESEPCDTERSSSDAAESTVSARVRRNMLPCIGEVADGEVWGRTAEWRGINNRCRGRGGAWSAGDLPLLKAITTSASEMGLMRKRDLVPVEPYCGSCGCQREDRHEINKERAVLYTHHPTAPPMQVRFVLLCSLFICLLVRTVPMRVV